MAEDTDVVKWFTRARKFPQLIGRTPDGAKIPFGPYTITQALVGFALLFVGFHTMGIWAHFGFLGNLAVLLCLTAAAVYGLGRLPIGARNPISVLSGATHATFSPRLGRVAGRSIRISPPHQVRHAILLGLAPTARPDDVAPLPTTSASGQVAETESRPAPLTGVQTLLARPTQEKPR